MANFAQPSTLDDTGVTKVELQNWAEGMIPQTDLINPDSTFSGLKIASNKIGINGTIGGWYKYQVAYSDFATAATTSADSTVVSLGIGAIVHYVKLVTTTGFTGGGAATCTMDVGTTSGTPTEYLLTKSVFATSTTAAAGTYTGPSFETENAATAVLARIICDVNCSLLTAGAADIWIFASFADSGL